MRKAGVFQAYIEGYGWFDLDGTGNYGLLESTLEALDRVSCFEHISAYKAVSVITFADVPPGHPMTPRIAAGEHLWTLDELRRM